MKGLADKPSYIIELLEGGVTLEDVIDGHICEQALVSTTFSSLDVSLHLIFEAGLYTLLVACLTFSMQTSSCLKVEKSAFVVGDLGGLMQQHVCWQNTAPRLRPYFPVSCNRSPVVIEVLASLGLGFVCANKVSCRLC